MTVVWFSFFIFALCHQYHGATEITNCTAAGRFPNNLSSDCRGYTMCLRVLNDFTRIDLVCPEHSVYSHSESQCTNITSYACLPEHNCTHIGDLPNPTVNDCASYISCVDGFGGIATARLTYCAPGLLYSPTDRACINETLFECTRKVTTTEPPKVFEVSVKYSPIPHVNNITSTSNACYMKSHHVFLAIILLLCNLFCF